MPKGGKRAGAGRPKGTGKFGVPTKAVRLPASEIDHVLEYVENKYYRLPFFQYAIAAGTPTHVEADCDLHIDLNSLLIKHPTNTFLLRVTGLSMINAGINHGDILVVDRSLKPADGKIVIAAVNGELTVKRLSIQEKNIQLLPENKDFQPIEISEDCNLHIWGVVTNVIHNV